MSQITEDDIFAQMGISTEPDTSDDDLEAQVFAEMGIGVAPHRASRIGGGFPEAPETDPSLFRRAGGTDQVTRGRAPQGGRVGTDLGELGGTLGERGREAAVSPLRGAFKTLANMPGAASAGIAQLERFTGPTKLGSAFALTSNLSQRGAERIIQDLGIERTETDTLSASSIIQTAGEAIPQLGAAVGVGIATQGLGLPFALAAFTGTVAAPVVGAIHNEALKELEQKNPGADDNEIRASNEALIGGAITMVTSLIPGIAILRKVPGGDQVLRSAGAGVASRMGVAAIAEGSQEVAEGFLQDVVAEVYRRDNKELMPLLKLFIKPERLLEFIVGAMLGGAARGGVETVQSRTGQREAPQDTPTPEPAIKPKQEQPSAEASEQTEPTQPVVEPSGQAEVAQEAPAEVVSEGAAGGGVSSEPDNRSPLEPVGWKPPTLAQIKARVLIFAKRDPGEAIDESEITNDPFLEELADTAQEGSLAVEKLIEERAFGPYRRSFADLTSEERRLGEGAHDALAQAREDSNELLAIVGLRTIPELTSKAGRVKPVTDAVTADLTAKEPFQLTKEQYVQRMADQTGLDPDADSGVKKLGTNRQVWESGHRSIVNRAFRAGETIPDVVRLDFPKLNAKLADRHREEIFKTLAERSAAKPTVAKKVAKKTAKKEPPHVPPTFREKRVPSKTFSQFIKDEGITIPPELPGDIGEQIFGSMVPQTAREAGKTKAVRKRVAARKKALTEARKLFDAAVDRGDITFSTKEIPLEPEKREADAAFIRAAAKRAARRDQSGFVNIEPLVAVINAASKSGKWTVQAIQNAGLWLQQQGVKTMKAAREALRKAFGTGTDTVFGKIWKAMKDFEGGGADVSTMSVRPVSEATIKKIIGAINTARPIRKEFEAMKVKERSERAKRIQSAARTQGGKAGLVASLSQAKGEFERPSQGFEPFADQITDEEVDSIMDHIEFHQFGGAPQARMGLKVVMSNIIEYGYLPTDGEIANIERLFGHGLAKALLRKRLTRAQQIRRTAFEIFSIPKSLKASWDLSAFARQGFLETIAHPIIATRNADKMIRAFASESYTTELDNRLRSNILHDFREADGVDMPPIAGSVVLAKREEVFSSPIVQRIPIVRALVRPSERAYVTYLNLMRANAYDLGFYQYQARGMTRETHLAEYKALAKIINASTGRGNINLGELGVWLNGVFFSPRMMWAHFEYPVRAVGALPNPVLRRMAARHLIGTTVFLLMIAGMIKIATEDDDDVEIELDPRSNSFLKLVMGRTSIDLTGGRARAVAFVAQLLSLSKKDRATGKVSKASFEMTLGWYLRGKASPSLGAIINQIKGERFGGKELTVKGAVVDLAIPISAETVVELWDEYGMTGMWLMAPETLGLGVTVFEYNPDKKSTKYHYDTFFESIRTGDEELTQRVVDELNKRKLTRTGLKTSAEGRGLPRPPAKWLQKIKRR